MIPITTNLLEDVSLDHELFNKEYTIVRAICGKYSVRANFCDHIKTLNQVLSVRNSGNMSDVFILCRKSEHIKNLITDKVTDLKNQGLDISVSFPSSHEVSSDVLIQLMLNSMSSYGLEGCVSNISGRMLCPVDFKKYRGSARIEEIITLEFTVKPVSEELSDFGSRLMLSADVSTFTNLRSSNKISFRPDKPSGSYPRYVLTKGALVRAFEESSDADLFINRKKDGHKSSVDMMDFSDLDKLDKTKSSVIEYVLEGFNSLYGKIIRLDLKKIDLTHHETSKTNRYDERTSEFFRNRIVRIINMSADKNADEVLKEGLASNGFRSMVTKQNGLNTLCLHIVNPIGTEDDRSYRRDPANTIQHISSDLIVKTDDKGESKDVLNDTVLKVCLKELFIKDDVRFGQMRLYDWNGLDLPGEYVFGRPVVSEDDESTVKLAWISVQKNGVLDFGTADDFSELRGIYTPMIISEIGSDGYFVIDPDGNCVTVSHTDIISVPSAEPVRERLMENRRNPANGKTTGIRPDREILFPECTDTKYRQINDQTGVYMTGAIGAGMNAKVSSAANFRLVRLIAGNELFMDKLVEMMDVPFIRYNQTTVIPFPVKYLDEWMKMQP